VLDVDRQMCLLRFPGPNTKMSFSDKGGRDCVVMDCQQHTHIDEWVYRGDADRFPTLQPQATNAVDMALQRSGGGNQLPSGSSSTMRQLHQGRTHRQHYEAAFICDYMDRGEGLDFKYILSLLQFAGEDLLPSNLPSTSSSNDTGSHDSNNLMQTARKSSRRQTTELASTTYNAEYSVDELAKRVGLACAVIISDLHVPDWKKQLPSKNHQTCSPKCMEVMRGSRLHEVAEYAKCSPFLKPLLMGWTRMVGDHLLLLALVLNNTSVFPL